MSLNIHKYIVKRWIFMRMAAQEFYYKEPFEIEGEYPIMKSILFFALIPIELIFIFFYARFYGSLNAYNLQIILILVIINLLISNLLINNIKNKPFIGDTIASYEQMDHDNRKKAYSFKNGVIVTLLVGSPWILLFIAISIVFFIAHH